MKFAASARVSSSVPSLSSIERVSLADQRRHLGGWAWLDAQEYSQILVSSSDAATAANATRNAVIRSWIMA
jgi:hypothetical protein